MFARLLITVSLMLLASMASAQSTGSFTLTTKVNGDGTLTPTLTWSTTPEASTCTASGDTAWSGTKAASGTQALAPAPTTQPRTFALLCSWPDDTQAFLTWTPPTENTDGTALTDLAGYRVQWGKDAAALDKSVTVSNPSVAAYTVTGLTPGSWFFGVRAYNTVGAESELSNLASKDATEGVQWSQQTGFKVPKAPVMIIQ